MYINMEIKCTCNIIGKGQAIVASYLALHMFCSHGEVVGWGEVCQESVQDLRDGCAANISQAPDLLFSCPCGRSFRCQGHLTRHSRFCDGVANRHIELTHFPIPVGDLSGDRVILQDIVAFAQLSRDCSLSLYPGITQGYHYHLRMGSFKVQGVDQMHAFQFAKLLKTTNDHIILLWSVTMGQCYIR